MLIFSKDLNVDFFLNIFQKCIFQEYSSRISPWTQKWTFFNFFSKDQKVCFFSRTHFFTNTQMLNLEVFFQNLLSLEKNSKEQFSKDPKIDIFLRFFFQGQKLWFFFLRTETLFFLSIFSRPWMAIILNFSKDFFQGYFLRISPKVQRLIFIFSNVEVDFLTIISRPWTTIFLNFSKDQNVPFSKDLTEDIFTISPKAKIWVFKNFFLEFLHGPKYGSFF